MPRSHVSHRRHSSSFTKFVTRFQRTFSSKNIKASTPIVPTQSNVRLTHPAPVRKRACQLLSNTVQFRFQFSRPSSSININNHVVDYRRYSTILTEQWNTSATSTRDHIRRSRNHRTWRTTAIHVTIQWATIGQINSIYPKWTSAWTTNLISGRVPWNSPNHWRRLMLLAFTQRPFTRSITSNCHLCVSVSLVAYLFRNKSVLCLKSSSTVHS